MGAVAGASDSFRAMSEPITYPGARRPDRRRTVESSGLELAVYEWGDESAPPLLLAHGGFDFAGTYDGFAPLLADGGWRVVSYDHRGHGDSAHAALYNWEADIRDAAAVLDSITNKPIPFVGHSKGGNLLMQLCDAMPHRVSAHVNLDGIPVHRRLPDVQDHARIAMRASEVDNWLSWRRTAGDGQRKPGTIDELAQRRRKMNPRLDLDWLRYLVTIGAREDEDGWRWKIDPTLRFGGFGPWRPEWSLMRLPNLSAPLLFVLGLQPDPMGWEASLDAIEPWLPAGARAVAMEHVGHFMHIEDPKTVAELALEFLS